jgi:hypothetical protein
LWSFKAVLWRLRSWAGQQVRGGGPLLNAPQTLTSEAHNISISFEEHTNNEKAYASCSNFQSKRGSMNLQHQSAASVATIELECVGNSV